MFLIGRKSRLIKKARESKNKNVRQAELKSELDLRENEDILIVEKSNMMKFMINVAGSIICLVADISIITFSVIGLAAVLFPNPRQEMLILLNQLLLDIRNLI